MNKTNRLALFLLIGLSQVCFGQAETATANASNTFTEFTLRPVPAPLVVVQVDQKSMVLNAQESEEFMPRSLQASTGIRYVSILDEKEGNEKFGAPGKHGVIIVVYKDVYKIPFKLQSKFLDLK